MTYQSEVQICNKLGLHARASALLVKTAGRFRSEVTLRKGDTTANAKSILGVLTLAAGKGSWVTVRCEGDDAEEALKAVVGLIEEKFMEE